MGFKSDLTRGTIVGLVILGIGGRILMRVAAHMEGRVPSWTPEGTVAVVFYGTVAGAATGVIYYLLRRSIRPPLLRSAAFIVVCALIAGRGVSGLLPSAQAMFMMLALVHIVIVDILARKSATRQHMPVALPG